MCLRTAKTALEVEEWHFHNKQMGAPPKATHHARPCMEIPMLTGVRHPRYSLASWPPLQGPATAARRVAQETRLCVHRLEQATEEWMQLHLLLDSAKALHWLNALRALRGLLRALRGLLSISLESSCDFVGPGCPSSSRNSRPHAVGLEGDA